MPWMLLAILTAFILSFDINAGQIKLGAPLLNGTGCPPNTTVAVLSPDEEQLSILFNSYSVEAQGEEKTEQKTCEINVPISLPSQVQMTIHQMDFRGYTSLPKNATAVLTLDHDFFGGQGPKTQEKFEGERDGEFTVTHQIDPSKHIWSKCGANVNLRIRSSIKVKTNKKGLQTLATVDSADLYKAGMKYHVKVRKCEQKNPKNPKDHLQ
jgi:hypothetical protein